MDLLRKLTFPISDPILIFALVLFIILIFPTLIKDPKSKEHLYPLTIVNDDDMAAENIVSYKNILEKAKSHASSSNNIAQIIPRIDTNVADGIARTVK